MDKDAAVCSEQNRLANLFGEEMLQDAFCDDREREPVTAELERYHGSLRCRMFTRESGGKSLSDPLAWWKAHSGEYPRVAELARSHLSVAATSVGVERVFSKGGWIVNKRRCSLADETVSLLMFLACNLHHL